MTNKPPQERSIIKVLYILLKQKLSTLIITYLFISLSAFSQTYTIAFGDTINRIDKYGKKQGFWIEKNKGEFESGNHVNNLREGIWKNLSARGESKPSYWYKNGKKMISVYFYGKEFKNSLKKVQSRSDFTGFNNANDTNLYINIGIKDESLFLNNYTKTKKTSVNNFLDSIEVTILDITNNKYTHDVLDSSKYKYHSQFREDIYKICLAPNKQYKISFSKKGYLIKSIAIDARLNLANDALLWPAHINVFLSNRILNTYDPIIINEPSIKYYYDEYCCIKKDYDYEISAKLIFERKSEYEIRKNILSLENSINQQIQDLKEKQLSLENERKLKEEELKRIESDNKRKELELSLLEKEKSLSAIVLKSKEAELIKNQALANEKKKEIENLNQQKIINELNIKNKESELIQKNIESENRQKQIKGLEHEKELSNENLKQQKFIRNLVLTGAGLLTLFLVFVFISLSKSRKANKIIALQKTEVEEQKHLVEEKQKEIVDSISYAKRLQEAILPPKEFVNAHLTDSFIYYQPKDIVAGDFYWAEKVGEKFFIAAADSTGHGVPGAMVSVVCSNALNRTIKEFKLTETGKILDKTRELVLETFEKSASEVKDGMDISLLCIDSKNKNIFWSGANNPLWYIQDNELKEIKADKQPIGKSDYPKPFTTHQIEYKENTTFYLFTDGLADQFGGPNGKKFKYKQFSDLLIKSNNLSQKQQADIINKAFSDWKGDLEQVDDVCVIGIKL